MPAGLAQAMKASALLLAALLCGALLPAVSASSELAALPEAQEQWPHALDLSFHAFDATLTGGDTYFDTNGTGYGWNGSCPGQAVPQESASGNAALEHAFGEWMAAWTGFLFITIASSQVSLLVRYLSLPLITGYMFFGVLVGPQALEMVSKTDLTHLQPITQFALAFISMSAGAELYLPELRALFRRIITITMSVTAICFLVCMLVIFGLAKAGMVPFMSELSGSCQFSISLIAASIMVTQSPASAIAVVAETKSKGPFTSTMLGITVLTDIVVLLLYSICASVANANCSAEADGFHIIDLVVTVGCLVAAGILGYLFGKLIIFLLWLPRIHGEWAVLPLGFGVFKFSSWFTDWTTEEWGHGVNFDALLICIFAGYVVANHSRNRRKFLRFMGSCGPIIFIPFFTLTGAGLNLKVMGQGAGFAVIVFAVRALTFAVGSGIGGHYTGMEPLQLKTLWISMLTQAGVSLGIAAEVAIAFPAWGTAFQSTIVSVVLINQVIGPVVCKWALRKNGEDGMALGSEEEEDEDRHKRAVIVGINISSLAVAARLLKHDWNVLFVDTDMRKTDMLQWLKYEKRKKPHRTPAEIKKRQMLRAAREAARARKSFVDLNPPREDSAAAASSAEPSVASRAVDEHDVALEHSSAGAEPEDSQYQPVTDDSLHVSVEGVGAADSGDTAAGAAASFGHGGLLVPGEDMSQTSSLPEEKQVQFLLLESLPGDLSAYAKDPLSKLKHAREALGLRAILTNTREQVSAHGVDAALVCFDSDELNFDLCAVLQEHLHLKRVIAEVQNPQWASMFASVGVLTVFPYSLAAHTVAQMVLTGEHQQLELVPPTRPLHVSLSHVIKPDTLEETPLYLRQLSPEDQRAFTAQHPDPPLPRDQLWKFDEKLKVVNAAVRDEYMKQIASLHGNNFLRLDHASSFGAAAAAFQGPGMLNLSSGAEADPNDPDEQRIQEARRQQQQEARENKRAKKASKALGEDQDV